MSAREHGSRRPIRAGRWRLHGAAGVRLLVLLLPAGCQSSGPGWSGLAADNSPQAASASAAEPVFTNNPAGSAFQAVRRPAEARIDVLLRVLHVQVPHEARGQVATVWELLREDVLDSETRWRLQRNGLRVGVGLTERWEEVQAAFNAIAGQRVHELPPLRTAGVALALELDNAPADQTIFFIERDEILTGDTWPASRRVLRVTYTLDARDVNRAFLAVVPEIRQRVESDLSYGAAGWSLGPRRQGRAFAAAAFALPLRPNEFLLLAPGEKAEIRGLVGGAFLKTRLAEQLYDSYVFLRVDIAHVRQRR